MGRYIYVMMFFRELNHNPLVIYKVTQHQMLIDVPFTLKVGSHCSVIIPDSPWLWSVMITDRLWCLCSHCHNTSLICHWCITEASLIYGAHCLHNPNHSHTSFHLYMHAPMKAEAECISMAAALNKRLLIKKIIILTILYRRNKL